MEEKELIQENKEEKESLILKYEIKTNPLAMSKIKGILDNINISAIPDGDEDYGVFAQSVFIELMGRDLAEMNSLLRAITGTEDDFTQYEQGEIVELFSHFFEKLGVSFRKLMQTRKNELTKQSDMAIEKTTEWFAKMILEKMGPDLGGNQKDKPI